MNSVIIDALARWLPIEGRLRVHWLDAPHARRCAYGNVQEALDAIHELAGPLGGGEAMLVVENRHGQDVLVIGSERDRPVDGDRLCLLESSRGLAVWLVKQSAAA